MEKHEWLKNEAELREILVDYSAVDLSVHGHHGFHFRRKFNCGRSGTHAARVCAVLGPLDPVDVGHSTACGRTGKHQAGHSICALREPSEPHGHSNRSCGVAVSI